MDRFPRLGDGGEKKGRTKAARICEADNQNGNAVSTQQLHFWAFIEENQNDNP